MQTHGGAAAAAAITSRERTFRAKVSVDWNGNGLYDHPLSVLDGYAVNAQTDRSLKGAAPEEVLLVEGSSSAELTLNLQGNYAGQSLAALLSPYNRTSPFYRKNTVGSEVKYSLLLDTAFGTFEYSQFVGYVRTITPDRRTNNVEITALDRAETMRRPIQFPPWAIDEWHANRNIVEPQLVDASWVVDHCLRISDTSVTPLRPTYKEEIGGTADSTDGVQLWVSGTGALVPTIGWMARGETEQQYVNSNTSGLPVFENQGKPHPQSPSTALPRNAVGQRDLAAAGIDRPNTGALNRFWSVDRDKIRTNGTHYFGFTLITTGATGSWYKTAQDHFVMLVDAGSNRWIFLWIGNGQVWATQYNPSTKVTLHTTNKVNIPNVPYVDIEVIWDNTPKTGTRAFVRAGANSTAGFQSLGAGFAGNPVFTVNKGIVQVNPTVSFNDMYYAFRNASGVSTDSSFAKRPAKHAASLDNGLQSLSFLPTRTAEDAWSVVTEVAASEFGAVFWDEDGKFHFWNYETIKDKQDAPVRTYSIEDFADLTITNTFDSVRNIWSVEAEKWSSSFTLAYESDSVEEFYTPNNTTRRFKLWVDDIQAPDQFDLLRYKSEKDTVLATTGWQIWDDSKIHGFCVQYFVSGRWVSRDTGGAYPKVNTYYDGAGNLVVQVNNTSGYPIRFATTEAETNSEPRPAFRIRGTKIRKSDPLVSTLKNQESIDRYGGRNLTISGPWVQDWFSEDAMRHSLMPRMLNPIPVTDAIVVPGDPRVQLGDCVTLSDEAGFGDEMNAQIYGISRMFDLDEGLTDTLTIEMLEPPLGSGVIVQPDPVNGITFVSQSSAKQKMGRTLEVSAPPEMAVGDYMIAVQECTYNSVASGMTRPDASWTQLGTAITPSGSFHPHVKLYAKRVSATEPSKYTFGTPSDLYSNNTISITAWRGVHATDAFDIDPVFSTTGQSPDQTFNGLTTTMSNSMLVVHWLSQRYTSSQDNVYDYPTPQMMGRPTISSTFVYQGMAYELRETAGATGTRTATSNADPESPGRIIAYALRSA